MTVLEQITELETELELFNEEFMLAVLQVETRLQLKETELIELQTTLNTLMTQRAVNRGIAHGIR